MKLVFSNNTTVALHTQPGPATDFILKSVKHLQHINLNFKEWDNPYSLTSPEKMIVRYAKKLNLESINQSLLEDQTYLNYLHKIYEKGFDGNPTWLDFHEQIHRCEIRSNKKKQILNIDWRTNAGPLQKPFNYSWLEGATTKVNTGDIIVKWSELGKTPYVYWENKEPDDINRLVELSKPWIEIIPKFHICLEDIDFLAKRDIDNFNKWWQHKEQLWCKHWKIPAWSIIHQHSVIKIGSIDCVEQLNNLLRNNISIEKVIL